MVLFIEIVEGLGPKFRIVRFFFVHFFAFDLAFWLGWTGLGVCGLGVGWVGLGWVAGLGWAPVLCFGFWFRELGLGWAGSMGTTFNENSKLMKM